MPKPVEARERRWRREKFSVLCSRFSVGSLWVIGLGAAVEVLGEVIDERSDLVSSEVGLCVEGIELLNGAIALIQAAIALALEFRA
jgi:hypothetical protein